MATDVVKQIRKATRRKFTAEEKIRVVLEGLRGETAISEICRRHNIPSSIYYKWSKAFLDAGKNGLTRDTQRDATTDEVRRLKEENASLKTAVAETILENQRLKKVWACNSAEVSAHDCRIEIRSLTSGTRSGIAGEAGAFSARDRAIDLLPLAACFPPARTARLTRPAAESDSFRSAHSALAAGIAVLFGVDSVTGIWNMWDTRKIPTGRKRRMVHGILMLAADAGFVATAALAPHREHNGNQINGNASAHRAVAYSSLGIATAGYVYMLFTH